MIISNSFSYASTVLAPKRNAGTPSCNDARLSIRFGDSDQMPLEPEVVNRFRAMQEDAYLLKNAQTEETLKRLQYGVDQVITDHASYNTILRCGDLASVKCLDQLAISNPASARIQAVIGIALFQKVLRGDPEAPNALAKQMANAKPSDQELRNAVTAWMEKSPDGWDMAMNLLMRHLNASQSFIPPKNVPRTSTATEVSGQSVNILKAGQSVVDLLFQTLLENGNMESVIVLGWTASNAKLREMHENHSGPPGSMIRAIVHCCRLRRARYFGDKEAEYDCRKIPPREILVDLIESGVRDSAVGRHALKDATKLNIDFSPEPLSSRVIMALSNALHLAPHPFVPSLQGTAN